MSVDNNKESPSIDCSNPNQKSLRKKIGTWKSQFAKPLSSTPKGTTKSLLNQQKHNKPSYE